MDGNHGTPLVIVSIIVAIMASYAVFDLGRRASSTAGRWACGWHLGGALTVAIGLWTMHVIAILASPQALAIAQQPPLVPVSLIVAAACALPALALVARPRPSVIRVVVAGMLLGIALASMHYTAMAAVRLPHIRYDPWLVAASIAIAIIGSISALWLAFRLGNGDSPRCVAIRAGAAGVLGIAATALHYMAVAAIPLAPLGGWPAELIHGETVSGVSELAVLVSLFSFAIFIIIVLASMFDARLASRTRQLLARIQYANGQLRRALRALENSQQRYRSLFENHPDAVYSLDLRGRFTAANQQAFELLGVGKDDLDKLRFESCVAPEDAARAKSLFEKACTGASQNVDIDCLHADGSRFRANVTHVPIIVGKRVTGVYGIAKNVSRRHQAEQALVLAANALENTREGVAIIDPDHRVVFLNRAYHRITGRASRSLLGRRLDYPELPRQSAAFIAGVWKQVAEQGHWEGEIWNRRESGKLYPELLSISTVTDEDDQISHYVLVFNDISSSKNYVSRLKFIAHHDTLTGMPNRASLWDRGRGAIARAARNASLLAILFMDLDQFKAINDSLGHAAGDEVLRQAAIRLKSCLRDTDTLARLGGDEFVLMLEGLKRPEDAVRVAEAVQHGFALPFQYADRKLFLSASIGISCYPRDGTDFDTLMKCADAAMYQCKRDGDRWYRFFSSESAADAAEAPA